MMSIRVVDEVTYLGAQVSYTMFEHATQSFCSKADSQSKIGLNFGTHALFLALNMGYTCCWIDTPWLATTCHAFAQAVSDSCWQRSA